MVKLRSLSAAHVGFAEVSEFSVCYKLCYKLCCYEVVRLLSA